MKDKKYRFKRVTEKEFKAIKKLQDAGLNKNVTSVATGRSIKTIINVFKSSTLEEYRDITRKSKSKQMVNKLEEATPTEAKPTKASDEVKLVSTVMSMWRDTKEEVDRLELESYLDQENRPNMKALNESQDIGVAEVLVLGGYMVLNKLRDELQPDKSLQDELNELFDGRVQIASTDKELPKEAKDIINALAEVLKKRQEK